MSHYEKVLVSRHSGFQAIHLTENRSGFRTLRFGVGGASQSVVKVGDPRHLELPYTRLLPASLALAANLGRMLIVGLGGGSLPRFFHAHFPEMTIDVVELDPEVLVVAQDHCGFQEDLRLRVHLEDGRDFVETTEGGYDVVILDSFDAEAIPAHLTTQEFLEAVRKASAPDGVVIANIWGPAANPIYADMLLTYQSVFPDVYIFDVPAPGTKLFVALREGREISREKMIARASDFSTRHGIGFDLGAQIAGFRNSRLEAVRSGEVLRD